MLRNGWRAYPGTTVLKSHYAKGHTAAPSAQSYL